MELDANNKPNATVASKANGQSSVTSSARSELQRPESISDLGQHTQNYIEAYHATAEWIRFADAKAAVILTVGGALAGFLIPTIHSTLDAENQVTHWIPYWRLTVVSMFVAYVVFFLLSGVYAFLCINPLRKKGATSVATAL